LRRFNFVLGILLMASVGWPIRAAQTEGHAEISRPTAGDSVSGVVTILGSASSTSFDHYELSFGYDPNPTDTWFPIGEPVSTQVSFGRLGLWDTTSITDGTYALRLSVTLDDGSVLEDVVEGIQVGIRTAERQSAAAGTSAPSAGQAIAGPLGGAATPPSESVATSQDTATVSGTTGRGIDVAGVVVTGAVAGIVGLIGLGAYIEIRRNMRQRWGAIRSRRMYTGSKAEDRTQGKHS
jgi:hypothetical protein